ncbi:MAG: hypothetical protein ACKOTD_04100, partial [Phycisphaerales bacterium]
SLSLSLRPLRGHSQAAERAEAFIASRGLAGRMRVELETRTLDEVDEAISILEGGGAPHVTRIMLDNMARRDASQPEESR